MRCSNGPQLAPNLAHYEQRIGLIFLVHEKTAQPERAGELPWLVGLVLTIHHRCALPLGDGDRAGIGGANQPGAENGILRCMSEVGHAVS